MRKIVMATAFVFLFGAGFMPAKATEFNQHECNAGRMWLCGSAPEITHWRRSKRERGELGVTKYLSHPRGCPRIAFCACGAAVKIFGRPIKALWAARAWFKFPRTSPASGMVAVRSHHVFVLDRMVANNNWLVYDYNSGGHRSRLHVRSIRGWTIVDPRGSRWAMN